jgi:hypothetical protein
MYLRSSVDKPLQKEPVMLRFILILLGMGTLVTGVLPQIWITLVTHASSLLMTVLSR